MQKKIIALAVAGLVSSVAFAQTNVTVYGIVDMNYTYKGNMGKGTAPHRINDGSYKAIDDGGWDQSRFGLSGTEDLGNGLSVSFQQEFGLEADVNGGATQQRPSWVAISGKSWGTVRAGNFFTDDVLFYTKGGVDSFAYGEAVIAPGIWTWANNAVRFETADYSGFTASLGYSSNYAFGENDVNPNKPWLNGIDTDANNRAWFGDARYTNGGLFVGASYVDLRNDADSSNSDEWVIGAAYDFKVANVGLVYDAASIKVGTAKYDRDAWRLNVGIPITAKDSVYLSYTNANLSFGGSVKANKDKDASGYGVSYAHALSKRTSLYASAYLADAEDGFVAIGSSGEDSSEVYQNGIKLGVRHAF